MKRMIAAAVAILASVVLLALAGCDWNYDYVGLNYGYDYAYISLPDGSCVQGTVESWRDYSLPSCVCGFDSRCSLQQK